MNGSQDILVIGLGVIGLTTGIRLQEAGAKVVIWGEMLPESTTSSLAAAIFRPVEEYPLWSERSHNAFLALKEDPNSGISLVCGSELWKTAEQPPKWADLVGSFDYARASGFPAQYVYSWTYTVPVIEMPKYLPFLLKRFQDVGGTFEQCPRLSCLTENTSRFRLIVNCTGLGARTLVDDKELYSVRAQIVRVQKPKVDRFLSSSKNLDKLTYIIPRSNDCILGGTWQEHDYCETTRPFDTKCILERCLEIEPRLNGATIIDQRVGLRPFRRSVRLERVTLGDGRPCIHNYGHGGWGVTLSWGCAEDVVRLANIVQSQAKA